MKIGGNTSMIFLGNRLDKLGKKISIFGANIVSRNQPIEVTNPTVKLINPFTLLVSFTVDVNSKYQIVLQGDYKIKYKESKDGIIELSDDEIFSIIRSHQREWFKKE